MGYPTEYRAKLQRDDGPIHRQVEVYRREDLALRLVATLHPVDTLTSPRLRVQRGDITLERDQTTVLRQSPMRASWTIALVKGDDVIRLCSGRFPSKMLP